MPLRGQVVFWRNIVQIESCLESQNERKIERRSKRFDRERERKVLKKLSASAAKNFERSKALDRTNRGKEKLEKTGL